MLHLLLFYPSTWYICDFFLFHIESEGKGGWIIGGGAKGYVGPPTQIIGGGLAPPLPTPMELEQIIARTPFVMHKGRVRVERIFINNTISLDFRTQKLPFIFPY